MIKEKRANSALKGHGQIKYFAVIGVVLIIVALISYWMLATNYRNNISDMKNVLSRASQKVLLPEGGQEHWKATVTHGPSFLESFCVDTNCPQVEAYWYVPLSGSGYGDFEGKIMSYIKNDSDFSKHGDWHIQIFSAEVSKSDIDKLPKSADNKTWQGVHLFLYK